MKINLWALLGVGLMLHASCLLSASALYGVEVDGVAAMVGAETILKSEVVNEIRRLGGNESDYVETRNRLIDRKLILKAAAEAKMTMQEWLVDDRVREIIEKGFGGDRNRLMQMLSAQKIQFGEWRQRIKEDMIVGGMRWQIVDKNVKATPKAMRDEFKNHPERYQQDLKVSVSVILLKPEEASKREEVGRLVREKDFAEIAKEYSADSHAVDGGVWKDVNPAETFRPEICEEIAQMPVGTLSHWIELDGWSFLIRKDAESSSKQRTFAEAYEDIEANVKEACAKRLYEDWMARLRAETYIKVY